MTAASANGARDISACPVALDAPTATPRRRSNHNATDVVDTSDREPCPSMRMPTKPNVSGTKPPTPPMAASTAPNPSATTVVTRRTPSRSMRLPTVGSASAPASVPTRYAADSCDRDMPSVSSIGSTNTLTPTVWPGAVIARHRPENTTMRQP